MQDVWTRTIAATVAAALQAFAAAPADSPLIIDKLIADGAHRQALEKLSAWPASVARHLLASKAFDGLNQPAEAVREAESALALDPRSEAAHLQLGQIFLGRHTPEAALEIFSDALRQLPDSLMLRLGKGLALKDLARYPDAEAELAACLARRPDLGIAFDALATVRLHARRFEELQALATSFRDRQPGDYRGAYFQAAALDGLKGTASAVEPLLAESLRLNPRFAAAHALLGKVRLQAGNTAGAIGPLETALALRADYGPAALHLAQAYQKAGRAADAARAFQRVRELKEQERTPPPSLRYRRGR